MWSGLLNSTCTSPFDCQNKSRLMESDKWSESEDGQENGVDTQNSIVLETVNVNMDQQFYISRPVL